MFTSGLKTELVSKRHETELKVSRKKMLAFLCDGELELSEDGFRKAKLRWFERLLDKVDEGCWSVEEEKNSAHKIHGRIREDCVVGGRNSRR